MRVLGIDPSSQSTGFGIIDYDEEKYSVRTYGTIRPGRRLPFPKKLNDIRERLEELMATHEPEEVAIENPFYARNVKTALTLGQVRGAVLAAVAARNCSLYEYSALEIKKAVTGYGQADKQQVNTMVRALLHLEDDSIGQDASDALATAYCHLNTRLFQKKLEEQGAG
jgi:crossover junction endodeoxyribonuclease RuvC